MDSNSKAGKSRFVTGSNVNRKTHLHRSKGYSHVHFDCLNIMYNDKHLCDIVLIAEGHELHAHKLMLASCSAFFYYKFSKDRQLRALNRIEIPNMTYETLSSVVNYLYKSEITITEETAADLLAAAYLFGLKDLQEACCDFLEANLDSKNCIRTKDIALLCQNKNLVSIANDFLTINFSDVVEQDEFLEMRYDQVSDLISKDSIFTSDEEDVLNCVLKWVKRNLQQRKVHIFNLMKNVRFSLIPQVNILQRLEAEEWLTSDCQYNVFLLEVFKRHVLDSSLKTLSNQRRSPNCLMIIGVTSANIFQMELYLKTNIWLNIPEFPNTKFSGETRVALFDTTIYYSDGHTLKYFDSCDPMQTEWSECSPQFGNMKWYSMQIFGNLLYVVGGYVHTYLSSAKSFNILTNEWKNLPNMSESKCDVGLGVLNQNLYVVGGNTGNSLVNTVECYNPDSDTWCTMPSMLTKRQNAGVIAVGDTLYAIGGHSKNGSCKQVESFNPADQSWKKLSDMNIARIAPGVISYQGRLYAIGGKDGKEILASVEVYCPTSNIWTMLPTTMNSEMWLVSVAAVYKADIKISKALK